MGTCCAAHLAAKVRDNAPNAENGAITVTVVENLARFIPEDGILCDYCKAPAEFAVSYYSK